MTYDGVVVLGAPRSGTTLLRRFLDAHPTIHCPPETNLLRACARFLREEPVAGGIAVGVRSGLAFSGVDEDDVIARLRAFAFGLLSDLARQAGKAVWAEKTAFNAFYIDEIELLCAKQCRFICVYRHGMDVAVSTHELCEKMQMYPPELHEYVRVHPWPLEAFGVAWCDVSRRLKQFVTEHADRCLEVRYEDLVQQPAAQLTRICDFLDAPAESDSIIAAAADRELTGFGDWKTYQTRDVSNRSIGRWRTLPGDVLARVARAVNPGLELLGYEPVAIPRSLSGAASRRALQLSLLAAGLRRGAGEAARD